MALGVELTWAGGEHRFLLTIELLRALQQKTDCGPAWSLARLSSQKYFVDDVLETIRLALIGGGMSPEEARKKVKTYVEDRPLTESVLLASTILASALYGGEEAASDEGEQKPAEPSGSLAGE